MKKIFILLLLALIMASQSWAETTQTVSASNTEAYIGNAKLGDDYAYIGFSETLDPFTAINAEPDGRVTIGSRNLPVLESMYFDIGKESNTVYWGSDTGVSIIKLGNSSTATGTASSLALGLTATNGSLSGEFDIGDSGDDSFQIGVLLNNNRGTGYISIMELADLNSTGREPDDDWPGAIGSGGLGKALNPVFGVFSADAATERDGVFIWHDQTNGHIVAGQGDLHIGGTSWGNIYFPGTNKVGIGMTTTPEAAFEVKTTTAVNADIALDANASANANNLWIMRSIASSGNLAFINDTNTNITITPAGLVGILDTTPSTALDVTGVINATSDVTVNGVSACLEDGTNCVAPTGDITAIGNCLTAAAFGGSCGSTLTSTTSEILDMATDSTFTYQRNNAGTVTFTGKDDAGAADTTYDTTGAGAIIVGSADVTSVTLTTVGGNVTADTNGVSFPGTGAGSFVIRNIENSAWYECGVSSGSFTCATDADGVPDGTL